MFLKKPKTQQDLANAIGVPVRVVRELESGKRLTPSFGLVTHYLLAVGLKPNHLLKSNHRTPLSDPRAARHTRAMTWFDEALTPEERDRIAERIETLVEKHYESQTFAGPLLLGE